MKRFALMLSALILLGSIASTAQAQRYRRYMPGRYIPRHMDADDLEDYYEELRERREEYLEDLKDRREDYLDELEDRREDYLDDLEDRYDDDYLYPNYRVGRAQQFDYLNRRGFDRRYAAYPYRNPYYPSFSPTLRRYGFGISTPRFSFWMGR